MKISIIGAAGTLGSCTAFNILVHKLADEIVMVDPFANMLKAHSIDLAMAAIGTDVVIRAGSYEDMKGSDIVINTAGAPSGVVSSPAQYLPSNLPIVKENAEKINKYCPKAIVITATNPVDPLNYATYLMSKNRNRRQYIGYTLNDSLRFRMYAAAALGVKSSRVRGMTIGEHGLTQVMLFSTVRLDGKRVKFDEETKQKIRAQYPEWLYMVEHLQPKRTAGWTSAVGTTAIMSAIKNNTHELIPCNVVLEGEYGCHNMSMTIPAIIGKKGIERVKKIKLADDEQEGLKNSIETLSHNMRYVEQYLGVKS